MSGLDSTQPGTSLPPGYSPSVNRKAKKLIAQIRRDPSNEEAVQALKAHYESAQDYPSLANLLEGWASRTVDPELAADRFVEAADAVLLGAGDKARAAYLLEHALQRNPVRSELLDKLTRLLETEDAIEPLKFALQRLLLAVADRKDVDKVWHAQLEYRLGRVYDIHLSTRGKAMVHYRRALELNPKLLPALEAARRIYAASENHRAVAVIWELQVNATMEPERRVELLVGLARHRERYLDEPERAILALRQALREKPDHKPALMHLAELLRSRFDGKQDKADAERASAVYLHLSRLSEGEEALAFAHTAQDLWDEDGAAAERIAKLNAAAAASTAPPPAAAPQKAMPSSPSVDAWLHTDQLEPLTNTTGPLDPVTDHGSEMPPALAPLPHSRMRTELGGSEGREVLEVNLGPNTASNFYIGLEGGLLEGGVFAATYRDLPVGTQVDLHLTMPGGFVARALGRVRFRRDALDFNDDQEPGVAVEFEEVTPQDLELIARFANQRAPMLYDE